MFAAYAIYPLTRNMFPNKESRYVEIQRIETAKMSLNGFRGLIWLKKQEVKFAVGYGA